jgi:cytidyltransferase-like protein
MMEQDTTAQERTQWLDPIVVVSGGFDPVHRGHLELFKEAAEHGRVHVLLNSDGWLARKKGAALLPFNTRREVLIQLSPIHRVHSAEDEDGTVSQGLTSLRKQYPNTKILFVNGGDRKESNTPELAICEALQIKPLWNIGGGKIDSSSERLQIYEQRHKEKYSVTRDWGEYQIIAEGLNLGAVNTGWLTKILTIEPRKNISFQRHFHREEQWVFLEGEGRFFSQETGGSWVSAGDTIRIPVGNSHWVANTSSRSNLVILETWFGDKLEESDIERIENELTVP